MSLDAATVRHLIVWSEEFITWVKLLYQAPTARFRNSDTLFAPFRLRRGTRQGCPLLPLLFVVALEQLAEAIQSDSRIVGFRRGETGGEIGIVCRGCIIIFG